MTSVEKVLESEITILNDVVRIDIQTRTPGLRFDDAWSRRETMSIGGVEFEVVCREDLIAAKRAAGRKVDLEDVSTLEQPGDDVAADL